MELYVSSSITDEKFIGGIYFDKEIVITCFYQKCDKRKSKFPECLENKM